MPEQEQTSDTKIHASCCTQKTKERTGQEYKDLMNRLSRIG